MSTRVGAIARLGHRSRSSLLHCHRHPESKGGDPVMRRLSTISTTYSTAALRIMVWGTNFLSARRPGQGLVEYGLILVLIMVVCVGILSLVGAKVSNVWYTKLINNGAW
jgi:hypothetical protein